MYRHPTDAFEHYSKETHAPTFLTVHGVSRIKLTRIRPGADRSLPVFYRLAEMYFNTPAKLETEFGSPVGMATGADLVNFATGGTTMLVWAIED